MTKECRYCQPLECGEWHEAAQRVHASLVPSYWADELMGARAEAKKLWKVRHTEKPDYRTEVQRQRVAGAHRGGIAASEIRTKSQEPRMRPSRAAYMRKYRKTHPEAK